MGSLFGKWGDAIESFLESQPGLIGLFVILMLVSIVPTVLDLMHINHEDRIEKEPKSLLIKLFFVGVFSWFLAFILEILLSIVMAELFPGMSRTIGGTFVFQSNLTAVACIPLYAVLIVGFVEEGIKFLLLVFFTKKSKHFNCFFDGIVYAVFVSLGFALFECFADVVGELLDQLTVEGMTLNKALLESLWVALVRAVTDIIGHLSYAVVMGYFYGMSKATEKAWMLEYQLEQRGQIVRPKGESVFKRQTALKKAYWIPALVHAAFIFGQIMLESFPAAQGSLRPLFYVLYVLIVGGIYALYFVMMKAAHKKDDYLLNIAMKQIRQKYPTLSEQLNADLGEANASL